MDISSCLSLSCAKGCSSFFNRKRFCLLALFSTPLTSIPEPKREIHTHSVTFLYYYLPHLIPLSLYFFAFFSFPHVRFTNNNKQTNKHQQRLNNSPHQKFACVVCLFFLFPNISFFSFARDPTFKYKLYSPPGLRCLLAPTVNNHGKLPGSSNPKLERRQLWSEVSDLLRQTTPILKLHPYLGNTHRQNVHHQSRS